MFYHYIFPELMMLQFGGGYPWETPDKQDRIEMTCSDPAARVVLELKRISER
jgi:uncharacterized repeat protein (TIGR04076 family)